MYVYYIHWYISNFQIIVINYRSQAEIRKKTEIDTCKVLQDPNIDLLYTIVPVIGVQNTPAIKAVDD